MRIRMQEIDLDPGQIRRKKMRANGGLGVNILVFIVDQERIVPFRAGPIVGKARASPGRGRIGIIPGRFERPTNAAAIENESAKIQMAMVSLVVSAFGAHEQSVWILPGASKKSDLHAMKDSIQRPVFLLGTARVGLEPNQVKWVRGRPGFQYLVLLPRENRLTETAGEPEHFRCGIHTVTGIAIVECSAQRSGEVDAKPSGRVEGAGV